ncbi:MAG TPA: hypothetical protein VGO78_14005 [Acidimicrobiales bacterium]|jgi:hypothetical protein|nr:hypothetical protein [Acidimicrobiales bacterium]
MAKKRRGGQPSERGRLSWDGRLWDRAGRSHVRVVDELDRATVVDLLAAIDVEVAVSACSGPLRWVEPQERMAVWKTELAPDFHDQPGWRPPAEAPGQLPFHAELWQSDDHRVVLFTDRD